MRRLLLGLSVVLAVITGCGGGGSGGAEPVNTTSGIGLPSAGATAAIKNVWTEFFNYQTSAESRQTLLEDGASLGKAMALGDKLAKQQKLQETVDVKKVVLADATHANVTYDILSHGEVLLPNATGIAVQIDGHWLVTKQSFCGLIELGAGSTPVPGC